MGAERERSFANGRQVQNGDMGAERERSFANGR